MKNTFCIYKILIYIALTLVAPQLAVALPLDTYAPTSKLASGRWVKISVPETGLYVITPAQLRQWGFSDPQRVRVYGYGGQRIPDLLSAQNYIDDLPMVQTVQTGKGIVFYAQGPLKWVPSVNGYYRGEHNIYSTVGYYFLSESDDEAPQVPRQKLSPVSEPCDTVMARLHHEMEQTSPSEYGYLMMGENFKAQPRQKVTFDLPDRVDTAKVWMECAVVTNFPVESRFEFTVNGQSLPYQASDRILATSASTDYDGTYSVTRKMIDQPGNKYEIGVSLAQVSSGPKAWLDYITLNYRRLLRKPDSGPLTFYSDSLTLKMASATSKVMVWDVTNPLAITALNTVEAGGALTFSNEYHGERTYLAWTEDAALPSPQYVGTVQNQDLHSHQSTDMVILTLPEFAQQAERIAEMHRTAQRRLDVRVVSVNDIYNEFSSGSADVSGLRKYLKMLYDRGIAAGEESQPLKYVLIFGRSTYDNRHLTSAFKGAGAHPTIPAWMGGHPKNQLCKNDAYGTDDFTAMLADNSGGNMGTDKLSVALGRMPVRTVDEARNAVDKLLQYVNKSKNGTWKNHFLSIADDGNSGVHLQQTEALINCISAADNDQSFHSKIYIDAYPLEGGECKVGREEMLRLLDDGVMWWNFAGHASAYGWTSEKIFTYFDMNNLYISHIPVLMAATCSFMQWDSNSLSGAEVLFHERFGGTIATISASRPVYISENGFFTKAVGRALMKRDADGYLPRIGDIYTNAKNNIVNDRGEPRYDTNRLRYGLMGDPAMELAMPHNVVKLDKVGDVDVTPESQPTLKALQQTTLSGRVVSPDGSLLDDFNGTVMVSLYDAERSVTTYGDREGNTKETFEVHGGKIYTGAAPVSGGRFTLNIAMPGEVADNFRPATVNMYAYSSATSADAVGVSRDVYVYGYDESVAPDTNAPVIESFVLNHETFADGDEVNESPMVIARLTDDIALNISSAGVGHQMVLTLDGNRTYTDVSLYYTPDADGNPAGVINYPLSGLSEGAHSLRLKVWDTSGNSATREIAFFVTPGLAPKIFDVYTDANPASTQANFYLRHNRPDAMLTVTVSVYNLLGQPVWSSTAKGRSDMFLTSPVTWNLNDASGRRVSRGIYLYRASISADNGETFDTASRKIAVTAP